MEKRIPKFEVIINPAREVFRVDWEFTGQIKYVKYATFTRIFFEIEYEDYYYIDHIFRANTKMSMKIKDWISEKSFYLNEIPAEEIYDCNATP